jgi:O-antigen/teichoic acid export membrane protein
MQARLTAIFRTNRIFLLNSSSLVGTTAITAGLGFFYWWVAARLFTQDEVGLASALTSNMMLIMTIGVLGLGTLLIGELPRHPERAKALIMTALVVAGGVSAVLGVIITLITAALSPEFEFLSANILYLLLFALGVGLSAVTQVLDQALIGLLRGSLQFWRNAIFAASKLGLLVAAGLLLVNKTSIVIYTTWVAGNAISLAVLLVILMKTVHWQDYRPDIRLLRNLRGTALQHHLLNLTLNVPALTLPLLVTTMLSASTTASFYIAWMITSLASVGPTSLTTVLYAVGAGDPVALASKTRFTLKASVLTWGAPYLVLFVFAPFILGLFGSAYVGQADWALRFIGLSILPQIIKSHYVPILRIYGRIGAAIRTCLLGAAIELTFCAIGAQVAGLSGLALGLVLALTVEAAIMAPTVYRTAAGVAPMKPREPVEQVAPSV